MTSNIDTSNKEFSGQKKILFLKSSPSLLLCGGLGVSSSDSIAVRFVAVGFSVLEGLHLLTGRLLVSDSLFFQQVFTVEEQVTWQQEAGEGEDQQAHIDLKKVDSTGEKAILKVTLVNLYFIDSKS